MLSPSPPVPSPQIVKLDNVDHGDLTVAVRHDAAFGDAVNQVAVFPTEFEQVQRDYPILFRQDSDGRFYAIALTGLDLDENLFLGPEGWTAHYVPAVRQHGPFVLRVGEAGEAEICVDMNDPRVGDPAGEPLFLRHGGTAPYLLHVGRVLETLRRGVEAQTPFFEALVRHELIKPVTLDVEIDDGLHYRIDDVFAIDGDRLAALSDADVGRLHRGGVLRAAIMASASLDNVARLIELKRRRIAA